MPRKKTGGQISPDGRAVQAPGSGRRSKRHDLEGRTVPRYHGSDLQQGDVQRLEQAQSVAPIRKQPPARPPRGSAAPAAPSGATPEGFSLEVPDAGEFIRGRLGNTLGQTPAQGPRMKPIDPAPWQPLIEKLATAPGNGGQLAQAYLASLSNLVRRPVGEVAIIDMNELDDRLVQVSGVA